MVLTQELHTIRAHLLHYSLLLSDFRKTIKFIRTTPNPAMDSYHDPKAKHTSAELMRRECSNLMKEIDRLDLSQQMVDTQLQSVMKLVIAYIHRWKSNFANVLAAVQHCQNHDAGRHYKGQLRFVGLLYSAQC
jgi:hypothetical protein